MIITGYDMVKFSVVNTGPIIELSADHRELIIDITLKAHY